MTPELDHLPRLEKAKARREFVKANRERMSIEELAIATGTTTSNVNKIFKLLDDQLAPAPKKSPNPHGYATWECHKTKKYLSDNYGGCF